MGSVDLNELFLIGFLFTACVLLIPFILFLITQQNILKSIPPQHRSMSPGQVWLQLIPLFNIVWQFIVVSRIANSIGKELASENSFSFERDYAKTDANGSKPTKGIGMAYCILGCFSIIPFIGIITGLAAFVCWIIYWIKLASYKNKFQAKTQLSSL